MKKRVAVGLSGGVDSSVAAALLVEQGYEVTGVFIEAYNEPATAGRSGCRTDQDKKDALQVALKLGIKFQTIDVREQYKKLVVQYFLDEYKAGRTPNPDIVCNREVKFGIFYDWARTQEFDYVATGHYARITTENTKLEIRNSKKGRSYLQRPVDLSKDQTYWLWQVEREKLAHILFPLGDLTKKQVRAKAKALNLPNAEKPDSMGVCMMGELNVREWLKERLGEKQGEVVWKGQVIGKHKGLWSATVGERGGWILNSKSEIRNPKIDMANLPPLYVLGKDMAKNQLIVGEREECYTEKFEIRNSKFEIMEGKKLWVRIRNLGELVAVSQCHSVTNKSCEVTSTEPVFAPAPGQSAVFYDEEGRVVGGGVIK